MMQDFLCQSGGENNNIRKTLWRIRATFQAAWFRVSHLHLISAAICSLHSSFLWFQQMRCSKGKVFLFGPMRQSFVYLKSLAHIHSQNFLQLNLGWCTQFLSSFFFLRRRIRPPPAVLDSPIHCGHLPSFLLTKDRPESLCWTFFEQHIGGEGVFSRIDSMVKVFLNDNELIFFRNRNAGKVIY